MHWFLPYANNLVNHKQDVRQSTTTTLCFNHFTAHIPKLDELYLLCGDLSFHIVCIVETWLDDSVLDSELTISSTLL